MAFIWALRGALVGAAGVVAAIALADTPKIIHVANDTQEAISVVIWNTRSKNESIIEAGERKKFTVSDDTPTYIKVRKCMKTTFDAELTIYEHDNFTVKRATTGDLVLIAAQKGIEWLAEPSTKKKQNKSGKARKDGLYPHSRANRSTLFWENDSSYYR